LYLHETNINGNIESFPAALTHLTHLSLSYTEITGNVENFPEVLTNLDNLYLNDTNVNGDIENFPATLNSWRILGLGNTAINGNIKDFPNSLEYLVTLDLSNTNISGDIGDLPVALTRLQHLFLSNTNISGDIKDLPATLTDLQTLGLTATDISGDIGDFPVALTNLHSLHLEGTDISGSIKDIPGSLAYLVILNLSSTNISGDIGDFPTALTHLFDLNLLATGIGGDIRNFPTTLTNLRILHLSSTDINGDIGDFPTTLTDLKSLSLNNAGVNGDIGNFPFDKLTALSAIDLSDLSITLPEIAFDSETTSAAVDVPVKNLSHEPITPSALSQGGSYADGKVTWQKPENVTSGALSYTFSAPIRVSAPSLSFTYSGTVYQPFHVDDGPAPPPTTSYAVTFKDWDGTTLDAQTIAEGLSAVAPTNPTREGYDFTGWDKSFSNVTSDLTVTAQYAIKAYTVTFNDWDETELKTETVSHGAIATAPANPTRAGYNFVSWDTDFSNVTSDLTVTAQYVIKTYDVTFKDWNGTELKSETVSHGAIATAPTNPTREGYDFTGWDKSFSNVTSDLTVTAQYVIKTYDVTFKDWNGTELKSETVSHGAIATAPANPTRTGYTFTGWDKGFSNVTSDLTVTAQYAIKTYTVTFKDWNGTTLKTQMVSHGAMATAPENPTRTGYTFTGWDVGFSNITDDLTVTARYSVKIRNIVQGTDTYRFVNADAHFFSSGVGTYKITGDYYDYLLTAVNNEDRIWKQFLLDNMNSSWGGSCFGMAAVLSLTKAGRLTPSFFQSGANTLYKFDYPKNSTAVSNLINYYQLMQCTPTTNTKLTHNKSDESKNLEYVVNAMQRSEQPVIINFNIYYDVGRTSLRGGHAIVGYDITEEGNNYKIKIWDPNYLNSPSNTLTISKDHSSASFSNYYPYTFIRSAFTIEDNYYDYMNIQDHLSGKSASAMSVVPFSSAPMPLAAAAASAGTTLMTNYADFTIASSNGETAVVENGVRTSGNLEIDDGTAQNEIDAELELHFSVPALDSDETYTVTPTGMNGNCTTALFYDDENDGFYTRIRTERAGGFVFGADGIVNAKFDEPTQATLSSTLNDSDKKLYTVTVSGSDTSITVNAAPDGGMTVESASGLVDIMASGDYNSVMFAEVNATTGVTILEETGASVQLNDADGKLLETRVIGYKISFHSMGGTPLEAITNIDPNTKVSAPPNPVYDGYVFAGWYMDKGYTEKWSSDDPVTSDVTLFAKWQSDSPTGGPTNSPANDPADKPTGGPADNPTGSHTVTLKDGDTTMDAFPRNHNATVGILPTPVKTGYTFDGWYTETAGGARVSANNIVVADVIYYARWNANKYAVSFKVNGGKVLPPAVASKTVTYDSVFGPLPTPKRTGYRFLGWYTAKSGGVKVTSATKVKITNDTAVYAHWTAGKYTVKFNVNGGKKLKASGAKKTVIFGKKYGKLVMPVRKGYAFKGWYTKKKGGTKITAKSVVKITKAMTLYAQWKKK
jgi:uncharacterized repeat protein (TIGR02543 family)